MDFTMPVWPPDLKTLLVSGALTSIKCRESSVYAAKQSSPLWLQARAVGHEFLPLKSTEWETYPVSKKRLLSCEFICVPLKLPVSSKFLYF